MRSRLAILGLVAATPLLAGGGGLGVSVSPAIVLNCKADVAILDGQRTALCRSLHAALAENVVQEDRLRPLADGDAEATDTTGALRITLRLTRADARVIEGHLEWQAGDAPATVGPPVTVSTEDAPLGAWMYPSFAAGLLQVSKLPL